MKTKKAQPPAEAKTNPDKNAEDKITREQLDQIDHIAIPVMSDDLDTTVEFYLKSFSCSVIYRDNSWAFLRFGNIKLAFVSPDEHPPHLAFISARAEEFGQLKTHRDGTRSVYIKDPAANTIEIMAPSET